MLIEFVLQYLVSHVEYLTISGKVRVFDFGRHQKWIQHTQFIWECSLTASTSKRQSVFNFLKFGLVYKMMQNLKVSLFDLVYKMMQNLKLSLFDLMCKMIQNLKVSLFDLVYKMMQNLKICATR